MQPDYAPPEVDWAVPMFDPAKPDGFAAFMVRHRGWMERMLARELGAPVVPLEPMQTSFVEARR